MKSRPLPQLPKPGRHGFCWGLPGWWMAADMPPRRFSARQPTCHHVASVPGSRHPTRQPIWHGAAGMETTDTQGGKGMWSICTFVYISSVISSAAQRIWGARASSVPHRVLISPVSAFQCPSARQGCRSRRTLVIGVSELVFAKPHKPPTISFGTHPVLNA